MGLFSKRTKLLSDPRGVFRGPLAHAFACGAHMPTAAGGVWNAVHSACACCDADDDRAELRDSWGITDTAGLEGELRHLTDDRVRDSPVSVLLELRNQAVARAPGHPFNAGLWPDLIAHWCRVRGAGTRVYGEMVLEAARIWEHEERMASDGFLPRGVPVRTVRAYDFGRAVNLARWGVNAGYADERSAHGYIVRAGAQSMRHHGSWEEMSAGFMLGRAMSFDEGSFDPYYKKLVAAHRVLVSDPASPWLNLPWRM